MMTTFVALLGLAVGSFLNVVVHRVPVGASVVSPASRCPHCEHPIRARHNVPLLGWLLLRGRCADCAAPISPRYPLVEAGTATLFVVLTVRAGVTGAWAVLPAQLAFAALGVALALIDVEHHRLPDALVLPAYPVLAVLLVGAATVDHDWIALARAAGGAAVMYAVYLALALLRPGGMGWGDVKLAGVIGGLLGYLSVSAVVVGLAAAFLLGGAGGAVLVALRRGSRRTAVAFGPFMLAGALVAVLAGAPIARSYLGLLGRA